MNDVGIAVYRTTNCWIFGNSVNLACDGLGISAKETEGVRFICRNVSSNGLLRAYVEDRGCNSLGAEALEEACTTGESGFEFALGPPPELPIFAPEPFTFVWRWDAGRPTALKTGMQRLQGVGLIPGSLDGSVVTSTTPDRGIAEYRFRTPTIPGWSSGARPYWLWLRISSARSSDRLCVVELDGHARIFDSWLDSSDERHSQAYRWVVLNGRASALDYANHPVRPWLLASGVHELRIHTQGANLRIDELVLADAPPERFTLNDVLAQTSTRSLSLENDSVWEVAYDLLAGVVEPPVKIHTDRTALGRPGVEMTALGRGWVEVPVQVPRLGVYELLVSVRTLGAGDGSCYLAVDGVERVVLPGNTRGQWHLTGRIGLTEAEARQVPVENRSLPWKISLTPGYHVLRLRSRVPGLAVDQVYLRESVIDSP